MLQKKAIIDRCDFMALLRELCIKLDRDAFKAFTTISWSILSHPNKIMHECK